MKKNSIGNRLLLLRKKINLSRKDFCQKHSIPFDTYMSWEQGKREPGMSGVKKCLDAFLAEGLNVPFEWLAEGTNTITEVEKGIKEKYKTILDFFDDELQLLKKENENIIIYNITDDLMYPSYEKNDVVIGENIYTDFENYHMKDCIVKLEKEMVLRRLFIIKDQITLFTTNIYSKDFNIDIAPKIKWISPILLHKKVKNLSSTS